MRSFLFGLALISVLYVSIAWMSSQYEDRLHNALFMNGWILFSGLVVQLLIRFKSVAPRSVPGSMSSWNRFHVTMGFLVVLLFGLHTDWSLPDSSFEMILWSLFVIVSLSGVLGAWLTRAIPFRLEQAGDRIALSQLPQRQDEVAEQARQLIHSAPSTASQADLSNLYIEELSMYFAQPHNGVAHLRGSRRPLKQLLFKLQNLERSADEATKAVVQKFVQLAEKKNQLDFQYAHEVALKMWLLIHLPATYGLASLVIVHVGVVYSFSTGAR